MRKRNRSYIKHAIVGLSVAIVGVALLVTGQAATFAGSKEAESGVVGGRAAAADGDGASGGRAVRFGVSPQGSAGYRVQGKSILNSAGQAHMFYGLDRPSLEWSATGENLSLADYNIMKSWKANVVRLPLNQQYWLKNTSNYQATVAQQVQWINSLNMDVILDLHWSDKGDMNTPAAQQIMADQNSILFWKDVAAKYKDNPRVLFELYNEPHDISWSVWRNGGQSGGFTVAGMQQLYDAVRSSGASNLVIVGGIDWAFDLSGVPANRISGTNIVYATHPYDFAGKNTPSDWDRGFGNLSATDPVMMTEFGNYNCSTDMYTNILSYAAAKNVGWTAWAWYPGGCGFPALIDNWSGAPNAVGQIIKSNLQSR